jgi:hypothetical protein
MTTLPALPLCFKCDSPARHVTTMDGAGERPQIFITECTGCGHYDMYLMIKGALRRL